MKTIVDAAVKRSADTNVVDESIVHTYVHSENQEFDNVVGVIQSFDRWEVYFSFEGVTVGSMYLTKGFDMHHGDVCVVIGSFVHQDFRSDKSIKKGMIHYIKSFCATYGLRKYQRSYHIDLNNQLIKTKEVTNGFH